MCARQKSAAIDASSSQSSDEVSGAPRRKGRRLLWLGTIFLLASAVLGPSVIGRVPILRDAVINALLPPLDGRVSVTSAELDWWTPVALRGVEVRDRDGEIVAALPEILSEEPLWRIATSPRQSARFVCREPNLKVQVREGGSNLEDLLAPMLAQPPGGGAPTPYVLSITSGVVELADPEHDRLTRLADVTLKIIQVAGTSPALEVGFTATEETDGGTGKCRLDVALRTPPEDASTKAEGSVIRLRAKDFHLVVLEPVLTRLLGGGRLAGRLNSDIQFDWSRLDAQAAFSVSGRTTIAEALFIGPGLAEGDGFRSQSIDWTGEVGCRDGICSIEQCELRSDLAGGQLAGTINLEKLRQKEASSDSEASIEDRLCGWLRAADVQGTLSFDLPRLIEALARTIHVRQGVEVTSGQLAGEFRTGDEQGRRTLTANLSVKDLLATLDGAPIGTDQPLEVKLVAYDAESNLVIDPMRIRLDSLQALARGDRREGQFEVKCDLDRLARQLGELVDLDGAEFRGSLAGRGTWKFPDSGAIECDLKGSAERFVMALPGRRECREDRLELTGALRGNQSRIDSASLQVTGLGDELVVRLRKPVELPVAPSGWPIDVRLAGNISTWLARIPAQLVPADWQVAGRITGETQIDVAAAQIDVPAFRLDLEKLAVRGPDWQAEEALAKLEGSGTWNSSEQKFDSPGLTLTARSLAARAKDLHWQIARDGRPEASGLVAFQADLTRLAQWAPAEARNTWGTPTGVAQGKLHLAQTGSKLEFSADVDSRDFVLRNSSNSSGDQGGPSATPLQLALAGAWDRDRDLLQLDRCEMQALGTLCDLKGKIADCTSRQVADISGRITYDLESLGRQFGDLLGPKIQFAGKGTRDVTLRGPLTVTGEKIPARTVSTRRTASNPGSAQPPVVTRVSNELTGRAGLGWSQARVYGLDLGAGDLDLQLAGGTLQVAPLTLDVDGGKVRLAPRLLINQDPIVAVVDKGPLVDHVHLTPEICAGWLKFVAPLLADATEADGRFSIDLAGAAVPVSNPNGAEVSGTLAIHQAEVRPGGFSLQLIAIGRQVEAILKRRAPRAAKETADALLELPEQTVPFRVTQGRIWHEAFRMQIGDVTLRTRGSVGIDESVEIVAEIPILDEWVARDRYLKGLQGQTIQVPVRGTLKKPQVDTRVLATLAERLAGSAAESAVEGLLENQIKRLLPKGK